MSVTVTQQDRDAALKSIRRELDRQGRKDTPIHWAMPMAPGHAYAHALGRLAGRKEAAEMLRNAPYHNAIERWDLRHLGLSESPTGVALKELADLIDPPAAATDGGGS